MNLEALQDRLAVLEKEILRITNLASELPDPRQQDNYYRLAQDLQREARDLRRQIATISGSTVELKSASNSIAPSHSHRVRADVPKKFAASIA